MTIQIERWSESSLPNPEELKQRLRNEGYSVLQWSDAPGTRYGPHAHAEDQSHWIISGGLELLVGHETYRLRAVIEIIFPLTRFIRLLFPAMKR